MRRVPGLALLGLVALWIQGTLAALVPGWELPDLVFLVVVGTAIAVGGVEGLLVAALLGYAMDLLTGALLGEHAFLLVAAYAATRVANLQLNLLRPAPRAVLVAVLTLAYDLGHLAVVRLFTGTAPALEWLLARDLLLHAALNALFAPLVVSCVQRVDALLSRDEDPHRKPLRVQAGPGSRL